MKHQREGSEKIYDLVAGRQLEILRALGIQWNPERPKQHIHCPYPGHNYANPSWRWDHDRGLAYCTCGHSNIFGVVMKVKKLGEGRVAWQEAADFCREALGDDPQRAKGHKARFVCTYDY